MIKSYIWTFVNRFLHCFLILTFCAAYISANVREWLFLHFIFGILFCVGVLLRVIWGFVGTKYSRFSDFNYSGILNYLTSILGEKRHYVGHNPASSLAILIIFALGFLVAFSGVLQYGAGQNSGIFGHLFFEYSHFSEFKDLHTIFANTLLCVIIIHICGSLIDKFYNKFDALDSMISGYKRTEKDESVSLNRTQKAIFSIYLAFIFTLFIYLLYPNNALLKPLTKDIFTKDSAFSAYNQECGSCHIAYCAYLLPTSAWDSMMEDLENHFGDDASLDNESHEAILGFLKRYASDVLDTKFSNKIAKDSNEIAITKYKYWEDAHSGINPAIFKTPVIKSKANCQTCHKDAESGIFAKSAIDYKKLKNLKESLK